MNVVGAVWGCPKGNPNPYHNPNPKSSAGGTLEAIVSVYPNSCPPPWSTCPNLNFTTIDVTRPHTIPGDGQPPPLNGMHPAILLPSLPCRDRTHTVANETADGSPAHTPGSVTLKVWIYNLETVLPTVADVPRPLNNVTTKEWKTIRRLKKDASLVINKSDKEGEVVSDIDHYLTGRAWYILPT